MYIFISILFIEYVYTYYFDFQLANALKELDCYSHHWPEEFELYRDQ